MALLIIITFDLFDCSFSWHDILVESHGLFFDLIIFGILLTIYESIREKKDLIKRYNEEIDDYRFWESDEAKYRIRGLVRRLHKQGVTSFDLSHCYLKSENSLSQFTNLSKSKFTGANMSDSIPFVMSDVSSSQFILTNLSNSSITKVNLTKCQMVSVNLSHSDLQEVDFSDSNLSKADLSNATIIDCAFDRTNLTNVTLENAEVSDKDWFDKLKEWKVEGYTDLILKYEIGQRTFRDNRSLYVIRQRMTSN